MSGDARCDRCGLEIPDNDEARIYLEPDPAYDFTGDRWQKLRCVGGCQEQGTFRAGRGGFGAMAGRPRGTG